MNCARTMARLTTMIGILAVWSVVVFAQQSTVQSEHEAHHPAAQSQSTEGAAPQGGMVGSHGMMGGEGMMSSKQMMGMPMMMPYCPCMVGSGMMGMGMMMGGGKDSAAMAKMMQMHAEMMKANAAIMEKYAKKMGAPK